MFCPHCGSTLDIVPVAGDFVTECPRRHDGMHPIIEFFTTNTTAAHNVIVRSELDEPRGLSASKEPCSEAVDPNTPPPERAKGGE
jgi:hypothetical protein